MLFLRDQPTKAKVFVRGVVTRSGRAAQPTSDSDSESDSEGEIGDLGLGDQQDLPPNGDPQREPGHPGRHVTFMPDLEPIPDEEEVPMPVEEDRDQTHLVDSSDDIIDLTQPIPVVEPNLGDSHIEGMVQPFL